MNPSHISFKRATLAAAALAAGLLALPIGAQAGPQQGVHCASGARAEILEGSLVLRCAREEEIERAAVCESDARRAADRRSEGGSHPARHLTPDNPGNRNRDLCLGTDLRARQPVPDRQPGDPAAGAFELVQLPGRDVFRAQRKVYEFPVGGPVYNPFHKADLGVRCPAGWDAEKLGSNGLRCAKLDGPPLLADCDPLWSRVNDRQGVVDRCIGPNEGPTKPQGMTKVQHDLDRARNDVSWDLLERPGADRWQRKVYTIPTSSDR